MKIVLFFTFMVLCFDSLGKKLVITKCVLKTGTVFFTEGKCKSTIEKPKKSTKKEIVNIDKKPLVLSLLANKKNHSSHYQAPSKEKLYNKTHIVKGYQISLQGLKKWSSESKIYSNKLLNLKFSENSLDTQLSLMIDFVYTDGKRFTEEELIELVYLASSRYAKDSNEGQVNVAGLNIDDGKGIVANFTYSNIKAEYNNLTKGAIYKNNWLIQFTLYGNNLYGDSSQFVLNDLFRKMSIQKLR